MCNTRGAEFLRESLGEEVTEGAILDGPKASGDGRADLGLLMHEAQAVGTS